MIIPIYDINGKQVCVQLREPGKRPDFQPRGMPVAECLPHIERIVEGGALFACEGPTDAMALASAVGSLYAPSVVGCWSASIVGPDSFWIQQKNKTVLSCGDNDPEGQRFNQRLANKVGIVYPIVWPLWFKQKGDVKDWLAESGSESFFRLVSAALAREPLRALEGRTVASKRKYRTSSGLIRRLVEEAGGELAYEMGDGGSKYWCPLHDDRNDASLTINDRTGSWCCWSGCGRGGPPQWIQAWKGWDRQAAIVFLRRYQ